MLISSLKLFYCRELLVRMNLIVAHQRQANLWKAVCTLLSMFLNAIYVVFAKKKDSSYYMYYR